MPYIFKFNKTDKIINLVNTHPKVSFILYNGEAYYNNQSSMSGAFSNTILGVPSGYISLYEQSIDRQGEIDFREPGTLGALDVFGWAVENAADPTQFYDGYNPTYATFKISDGSRISFKTVSTEVFNTFTNGRPQVRNYPLSASISKFFWAATTPKATISQFHSSQPPELQTTTGSVSYLQALRNTLNIHSSRNKNYLVSSSAGIADGPRDLTSSIVAQGAIDVGLVNIPSIFYGDSIKKGSIDLRFYVTGALVGQLKDTKKNGDLIQVGPFQSPGSGSVAGVALYNEGFLILTGAWDMTSGQYTEEGGYGASTTYPSWVNFGQSISASAPAASGSLFAVDFSGSHKVPTLMLFANAPKNMLNHSNNPTYRDKGSQLVASTGSTAYIENNRSTIKNVVSSSYNDPTGSFSKTTYISKIGIYDKNKNLIAIAKVATPVKKTEEREFTFKLKLDI